MHFVYFLGRFHVLALHLPIGMVVAAVVLDWLARTERYRALARVAPFLWGAAAISAVLTAALGYLHFAEGTFMGPSASAHRFFGTTLAVVTVAIAWLAARRAEWYPTFNVVTGIVALALVTITGHFGGNLTHGSSFLFAYAPGPLRSLAAESPPRFTPMPNGAAEPVPATADPTLVDRLYRAGFLVRQVSQQDSHLVISVYSPGAFVGPDQWSLLQSAVPQIVELNLQDAGLDDAGLPGIDRFVELTRLRLSRNNLTDRTVAAIAKLPHLERLNLYSNPGITDASVDVFASMQALRRLDVWLTGMSDAGIVRLRSLRPDLELQTGTSEALFFGAPPSGP